jgi:hypothetical protein
VSKKPRLGRGLETIFGPPPTKSQEKPEAATGDAWKDAQTLAQAEPRITLVSPKAKALLLYLRKTQPEFNISKVSASLIEDSLASKYPELWKKIEHG